MSDDILTGLDRYELMQSTLYCCGRNAGCWDGPTISKLLERQYDAEDYIRSRTGLTIEQFLEKFESNEIITTFSRFDTMWCRDKEKLAEYHKNFHWEK